MKRILLATTLFSLNSAFAITPPSAPATEPEPTPEQGTTLPDYIGQIAEKDDISAEEYANMASGTMQVAMSVMQQGEKMPEAPIRDALDAVAAGRSLDPNQTDWDEIEQRLLDLLNPPHQDQQDQQNQQDGENSEDQEEQQDGEKQDQKGDAGSSEEGSKSSEDSESQSQQENSDQQQQDGQQGENGEQQDGENGQEQSSENQDPQSGEAGGDGEEGEMPKSQDGAQMGDLDQSQEEHDVQLDGDSEKQQQAPAEQMQTLGGKQGTGEPVDAETAAIKQMLDQLKQQDQPGKLYQILQEAQSGGKKKQQPNAKDW